MERYVEQFDFPCSSTFRDYYHFISLDGDKQTTLSREQQIEKGLIFPIESEPEFHKEDKLGFTDSKEVRAVVNNLENKVNGLMKMSHTHSKGKGKYNTYTIE